MSGIPMVREGTQWLEQLTQLYSDHDAQDVNGLVHRYVTDILNRSSSPVNVLIWDPCQANDLLLAGAIKGACNAVRREARQTPGGRISEE